jgi:hypothetical protein
MRLTLRAKLLSYRRYPTALMHLAQRERYFLAPECSFYIDKCRFVKPILS